MKLNKTQTRLLQTAAGHPHGRCCTTRFVGRGAAGGSVSGGERESEAARTLRDMGLLVFVSHTTTREVKRGHHTVFTEAIWAITDAGRAVRP
jgi:hypothetical protein